VWTQADLAGRAGPPPFSTREAEVLTLVAKGKTYDEVAEKLGISSRTVGSHLTRMYDRHGVSNEKEVLAVARRLGWDFSR
jgi:two-component system response regulator NreC